MASHFTAESKLIEDFLEDFDLSPLALMRDPDWKIREAVFSKISESDAENDEILIECITALNDPHVAVR